MNCLKVFVLFVPLTIYAMPIKVRPSGGAVEVLAIGKPSFIKIRGKGDAATGELRIDGRRATGEFEFSVASIDTGMDLRNRHMRENYLHTQEHPQAKLQIENLELNEGWTLNRAQIGESPFTGKLTLHGVTKPVAGKFKVGASKDVHADFRIKLSDFNIDVPRHMGVTVADEVNVEVKFDDLKEVK